MSAQQSLLKAIFAALSGDTEIVDAVGIDGILDRLGRQLRLPCIVFSDMRSSDWSTATEAGEEHLVTIDVFSGENGRREIQALGEAVRHVLHDRPLQLEDHHLANFRHIGSRTQREAKTHRHRATLQFRAVTEPA